MNNNKVHSKRTVQPFSKPGGGLSKDRNDEDRHMCGGADFADVIKLPPPPCPEEKPKASLFRHDLRIPPPPCVNFQQPFNIRSNSLRRSSFRKNNDDDPFLIAYIECTKQSTTTTTTAKKKDDDQKWSSGVISTKAGFGIKKNLSLFSCKHSSSANSVDNSIVRVSQLPTSSKSHRFLKKQD